MSKIVIPDPIWGIPEKYWTALRELGAEIYQEPPANQQEAGERIKAAEIITVNYLNGDRELIDAAPNLKYIVAPAVGHEWIDTEYAASRGIKVLNCPTFVTTPVAEQAIALLFALAKRLPEARADLQNRLWNPNKFVGFELTGKTLGLVGYGRIGRGIEQLATGLGLKVNHTNSQSSPSEIDELFRASDIICLCLPLTESTRHLVDKRRLALLQPSTYLINVARGAIVDQTALLESLRHGELAGAGLDVFEGEPGSSGQISAEIHALVSLPNVVATPHSSFNTPESLDRKGQEILSDIQSCLAGAPINVVN